VWITDGSFQQIKAIETFSLLKRYVHRIAKIYLSSLCSNINRKITRFSYGGIPRLCIVTWKEKTDFDQVSHRIISWWSKIRTRRWSTTEFIERHTQKRHITQIHWLMLFFRLTVIKANKRRYFQIVVKTLKRN